MFPLHHVRPPSQARLQGMLGEAVPTTTKKSVQGPRCEVHGHVQPVSLTVPKLRHCWLLSLPASLPRLSPLWTLGSPAPPHIPTFLHSASPWCSPAPGLPPPPRATFRLVVHLSAFLSSAGDAHSPSSLFHQDSSHSPLRDHLWCGLICKSVVHDHTSSRFPKHFEDVLVLALITFYWNYLSLCICSGNLSAPWCWRLGLLAPTCLA